MHQYNSVHHKNVPVPLSPPQICPSSNWSTTTLSKCHSVHDNPAPVPLSPPQICPNATQSTTNLPQCHSVHHKFVPVPLSPSQICPSASVSQQYPVCTALGANLDRFYVTQYRRYTQPNIYSFIHSCSFSVQEVKEFNFIPYRSRGVSEFALLWHIAAKNNLLRA